VLAPRQCSLPGSARSPAGRGLVRTRRASPAPTSQLRPHRPVSLPR